MNDPEIYRLSYTTLNLYERGDLDAALASYLGKPHPYPTDMMQLGKAKHKFWEGQIKAEGSIPQELGGGQLTKPVVERKHVRMIELGDNKWLQLVGVIDLEDLPVLRDWKVSLRPVNSFVSSKQKRYYKLLVPEAEIFEFRAFNPLTEQVGIARCYVTDRDMDLGLEWVISLGMDFVSLLKQMFGTHEKQSIKWQPKEAVNL